MLHLSQPSGFPYVNVRFLLFMFVIFEFRACQAFEFAQLSSTQLNSTIFKFHHVHSCRSKEYYDLDYFACVACSEERSQLQPTMDKFSCACPASSVTLYEPSRTSATCVNLCSFRAANNADAKATNDAAVEQCDVVPTASSCAFLYVNKTAANYKPQEQSNSSSNSSSSSSSSSSGSSGSQAIFISKVNVYDARSNASCDSCDLTYNFHYQGYCIANALLKPYLHYNGFWQATKSQTQTSHFGQLKFVAFFCLALRNASACNQLANLCVQSHYSLDKNSPCSAFLLTQVSDVVMKYANVGEQHLRAVHPFLFYKKGKVTAQMLAEPIDALPYVLHDAGAANMQRLELFSLTYALDGTLKRWGAFSLTQVNLCQLQGAADSHVDTGLNFAQDRLNVACELTLAQLIALASNFANDNYMQIYLNHTQAAAAPTAAGKQRYMQQLPVLIQTLTPENQRTQMEDWQLVKRFQLLEYQARQRSSSSSSSTPNYEDRHKLQLYRSLRYACEFVLHYDIHAGNRIGVPLLKLRFRQIELHAHNVSLAERHPFRLSVTYQRVDEGARRQLLLEVALPAFLLLGLLAALLRAHSMRRRRGATELCDVACFFEFLLQLVSHLAHALLASIALLIVFNSVEFLMQRSVEITLPLVKQPRTLASLVCLALLLKLAFLVVHLWRSSHYELFLIDWERPRSCDNNHFNLKSNLETSSVCSSLRTYVAESNVSAWRILFTANEWLRLSIMQKYSTFVQAFLLLCGFPLVTRMQHNIAEDRTLSCFAILLIYLLAYAAQCLVRNVLLLRMYGDPLQKFIDLCSLANISVFTLIDSQYGYYIHGRSPHGFADTDMASMVMQLQREAQNMCGRRGLLSDSDKQAYIILPPRNLRIYLERLLVPFQRSCSISQTHYQKELHTIDGNVERTSVAYASVNRFFCAFIDHAIKDMDYIIKEKSLLEKLCDCEIDNYLTDNKGTFYIDNAYSFGRLCLLGNDLHILTLEFLLLLATFLLSNNIVAAVSIMCFFNLLLLCLFRYWVRRNVSQRTLIDQRFLM